MVFTSNQSRLYAAVALLAASFVLLYWQVIAKLVHDWGINDNYSHGYLIPPLAAYLAWERRHVLTSDAAIAVVVRPRRHRGQRGACCSSAFLAPSSS